MPMLQPCLEPFNFEKVNNFTRKSAFLINVNQAAGAVPAMYRMEKMFCTRKNPNHDPALHVR